MSRGVSVVVPVKDGARYLDELLRAVGDQGEDVEVLVIDSGSSDGSVAIARAAGAQVLQIPPQEFGHGRTRNLGAERTSGELICFLTQDATPAPGWLDAYREAFELSDRVGAAYGPHLPRATTSPMIARELTEFFATFSPNGSPAIQRGGDPAFLTNVNACYLRACWEALRFDDLPYSEDHAFGRAMLAAGWEKVYHPGAAVLHAHDYGPVDFMRRYFDEYRGLRQTAGHVEGFGLRSSARTVRGFVASDRRWMREQGWSAVRRARWTARSALHHAGRAAFSALGSRAHALPPAVQRRISLEGTAVEAAPPSSPRGTSVPARGASVAEYVLERAREGPAPLASSIPGMSERTPLHVAFVVPPFRRGSGGHATLFQLLWQLERLGHTCSVWLHDAFGWQASEWPAFVRGNAREFFSPIAAPVFKGFADWYGADVAIATGWHTAYPVMGLRDCRARAYLIQDHEPEFYATSVESRWARETYDFDLYPITCSPWLERLMLERYGKPEAGLFDLAVDHEVYRPHPVERRRDTVIFYARGSTPRRAVPLGVLALEELHRRRPEVRIQLFGDDAPVAASFPHEHFGIAAPETLARLYSQGRAGVVLSMTNYSLIPQEMLACGLPCIDLAGSSGALVFGEDGPVEFAAFDPLALADAIERLLDDDELWERRSALGREFVAGRTWERSGRQLEAALRAALRAREA